MKTLAAVLLTLSMPALAGEINGKVTVAKGGGGILVYVVKAEGQFPAPDKATVLDQKHMEFTPYVLPILAGGSLTFKNSDKVAHNIFSPDGAGYNLGTFPPGETRAQTFKDVGIYTQLCSLHPEMEAYVVVVQNPYYALTKPDGTFSIKGVPDGDYQVRALGKSIKKKDRKKDFPVTVSGATTLNLEF
jgi:plastocyanin